MVNMTLSIPEDISKEMKAFSEIRWSQVARRAIIEKLEVLKKTEEIASKSQLTEKDALELSKLIKKSASKRLLDEYNT